MKSKQPHRNFELQDDPASANTTWPCSPCICIICALSVNDTEVTRICGGGRVRAWQTLGKKSFSWRGRGMLQVDDSVTVRHDESTIATRVGLMMAGSEES